MQVFIVPDTPPQCHIVSCAHLSDHELAELDSWCESHLGPEMHRWARVREGWAFLDPADAMHFVITWA